MALVFTDRNKKIVLHSWGRFRAAVLADVAVGDLLGLKSATATSFQLANEAATAVGAIAVAVEDIAAGETGWCALAAELRAPTTLATGGVATQTYFDDGTDVDIGQDLYLNDAGKCDETVGTTTAQRVGYNIARDRILLVPGGSITGAAGSFTSLAASGIVTSTLATDSTSSTTGAVKITGGVGIAKKLFVGTNLDVSGTATIDGASTLTGAVGVAGVLTSGNATEASSSTAAGTIVTGGLAVAKKANIGTDLAVAGAVTFSDSILHSAVDAETDTANKVLDAEDTGKIMKSALDGVVYTLPATAAGLTLTVMNVAADTAAKISVSPATADKIMGPDIAGADNKDLINTKATARHGDMVMLVGDGSAGWYVHEIHGTWAAET